MMNLHENNKIQNEENFKVETKTIKTIFMSNNPK